MGPEGVQQPPVSAAPQPGSHQAHQDGADEHAVRHTGLKPAAGALIGDVRQAASRLLPPQPLGMRSSGVHASATSASAKSSAKTGSADRAERDSCSASASASASTSASAAIHAGGSHSAGTQIEAPGSAWSQLRMLLLGFKQPGLEQHFRQYRFQQTYALDVYAAIYHALIALVHVINYPVSTWLQPCTQLGMLGYICAWGLPACLVLRHRDRLGPRGREMGVMLVDMAMGTLAVPIALGLLRMPQCSVSRVSPSGFMDEVLVMAGSGIMRAVLSQTRTQLFMLSFSLNMAAGALLSHVYGMSLGRSVVRYARVAAVAVFISAILEMHSRRAFLRLLANRKTADSKAGSISIKEEQQQQQQQEQQQQQQEQQQEVSCKLVQPQQGAVNPIDQLLKDITSSAEATAHSTPPSTAFKASALGSMAALLGPELVQELSAARLLAQQGVGRQSVKPYGGRSSVMRVGIKVRTSHKLAAGSPGFQRIADALISAVNEAAGGLVPAGRAIEHGPRVHAACVEGCVQLLAGISMAEEALESRGGGADAVNGLQALLQELVGSSLQALYPGQQMPQFEVTASCGEGSSASSSQEQKHEHVATASSSASTKEHMATPSSAAGRATGSGAGGAAVAATGELLACSPPCLAAGAGSTELRLLADVQAASAASMAVEGGSSASTSARVVVWGASCGVLVDVQQTLTFGHNLCKVAVPAPEQTCLLHLALLLGDHSLAFVQPLLVLPASAAAEVQQLWVSAVTHASMASSAGDARQQASTAAGAAAAGAAAAALTEAWQILGPLVVDIAYVVGFTAPAPAATGLAAALGGHSSPGTASLAAVDLIAAAAADYDSAKPWLGRTAGAAYQQLMVELLGYLYSASMWSVVDFVCSAAAASGRAAGSRASSSSPGEQQQQQAQQPQQQQLAEDELEELESDVPATAAAPVLVQQPGGRQWGADGTLLSVALSAAARTAGPMAALLLLPFMLLWQLLARLTGSVWLLGSPVSETSSAACQAQTLAVGGTSSRSASEVDANEMDAHAAAAAESAADDMAAADMAVAGRAAAADSAAAANNAGSVQQLGAEGSAVQKSDAVMHAEGSAVASVWRHLLLGFRQPALEQQYQQYTYQQTLAWDTCALVVRVLSTVIGIYTTPASSWLDAKTQISMLSWVVLWVVPAFVVLTMRRRLGPRGRETGVLVVDVAAALQAMGVALGWLALPHSIRARISSQAVLKDDILMLVGIGIFRTIQSQARTKLFAVSFAIYMLGSASASVSFGMPLLRVALRHTSIWIVAMTVSAVQELRNRRACLHLLRSKQVSSQAGGDKGMQVSSTKKYV